MEKIPFAQKDSLAKEDKYERQFRSYMEYLDLSNEDLQKPLLDVGAGDTAFIQYLRSVLGNKQAYGVEMRAGELGSPKEGAVQANGFNLPFKDCAFDIVTAKHYLPQFVNNEDEMVQALNELIRVTTTGGKIVGDIATPEKELAKLNEETDEKTKVWLRNRYEGAKKLQVFLEQLKTAGHKVDFKEGPKSQFKDGPLASKIVTIYKA